MAELQIRTHIVDGVPEVGLLGELDSYSAPRVRHLLETLLIGERPRVRMRLSGLEYIDSTGLGVLVGALKQSHDHAGTLVLIEPSPQVAQVLRVTGLDKVFTVLPEPPQTLPSPPIIPA